MKKLIASLVLALGMASPVAAQQPVTVQGTATIQGDAAGVPVIVVDEDVNASLQQILSALSLDATAGSTSLSTGPQLLCHGASSVPTSVTAGQAAKVWCTLFGATVTHPVDSTGVKLFKDAAALADNTSNPTVGGVQDFVMVYDGSTWDRLPGDSTNGAYVNVRNIAGSLAAGSALIGEVNATATATTTNGASTCYITSAATTNSTNCKASAGNVYSIRVINTTSTLYYLRMYNSASAPTCSSATGFVETIPVPHGTGTGAGASITNGVPQAYATGIGFCLTGGGSSTDNTSAATGVYVTILYK